MKRPAFQFYPADWRNNAKLRRCSPAARGVWVDVLCLLHDSEEYGVLRWPLKDIIQAAGASSSHVQELVQKGVLKGADSHAADYVFRPTHAGKLGEPVVLVTADDGPVWYSSRFVRDELIRQRRGSSTRFGVENQPPKQQPKPTPKPLPISQPKPTIGDRQGDGPTSSSSSSNTNTPPTPKGEPEGFQSFWEIWPKSDRKEARGKCFEVWCKNRFEEFAEEILAHVAHMSATEGWTKHSGQFIPAPLVYLNQRRWEGADTGATQPGLHLIGGV